jgi:branched-chain amino acid aminotransferase
MVRNGTVFTPPATEGALESITLDSIESIAGSLEIPFVRRPIDRTELIVADEMAICGTLAELPLVRSIDGLPLPETSPILSRLQTHYLNAVRGITPHPAVPVTVLDSSPKKKGTRESVPSIT